MKYLRAKMLLLGGLLAISALGCQPNKPSESQPLRLGWQPPWANQGQIVQVFKHTDVLARNGVKIEYKPYTFGGPMTEAALAGELDLLFLGDQPGITLMSRDSKWYIIARMVNYRSAFLVPPESPVRSLKDLKGKKVAAAFGSTTYRDAVRILTDAGLDVGKDVKFANLDQAEHASFIAGGGIEKWGEVDAIATYDPTIGVSVQSKQARVLEEWASPSVVLAGESVIRQRPDDIKKFLQAYMEAFALYAKEPDRFDKLYSVESRLPLSAEIYRLMAKYEPNLSITDPRLVNVLLSDTQQNNLQRNADDAFKLGIIKKQVDIRSHVNLSFADSARKEIK